MILILGAILGFISVAFGAYAEHGLRESITEENFRFLMTAIRYNQVNAVLIVAVGLALVSNDKLSNISFFRWSGILFIIGTILFSFSIYLSISFDLPMIINLTPLGGITIMLAWIMLIISAILVRKNNNEE
ncbi:MAG: DUF423 domain-containing protein [Pseudomonadota bacterium]